MNIFLDSLATLLLLMFWYGIMQVNRSMGFMEEHVGVVHKGPDYSDIILSVIIMFIIWRIWA